MYDDVFKSLNESVRKRNKPEDFLPHDTEGRDVIHRGYLKRSTYPIRYDMIPDGKTKNTGKHIYNFKNGDASGFMEIDHKYSPSLSGHETVSKINFEIEGKPEDQEIQIYRSFIVPSIMHHVESHKPDIIHFLPSVVNSEDLFRRLGSSFEMLKTDDNKLVAKRKVDPKISRIFTHIKKSLNNKRGN